MTAAIEIYTRPGCGYCSAAKSLLTRKKAAFTEFDVATDPTLRQQMWDRAGAGSTFPQIFIGESPCRRLRRAVCARPRRQARCHAGGRKGRLHERRSLLHRRDGADAHRAVAGTEPRARHQADPRSRSPRRRLCADPRGQQHDAAQSQGAVRASCRRGRRPLAESLPRAGRGTENPSPCRLAGAARHAGEGGQPRLPDRTRWRS